MRRSSLMPPSSSDSDDIKEIPKTSTSFLCYQRQNLVSKSMHPWHILLVYVLLWSGVESQSEPYALDAILQDYAYRAFVTPRTGVSFDAIVPTNLTGIQISAIRLRTGSLFTRGLPSYKHFQIPRGLIHHPYVERLVLVYQNLGNWSTNYYPLPGYTYLTPILGLLAYDASDLSAKNLPPLDIQASDQPISIDFGQLRLRPLPNGSNPRCVWLDLNGRINFTNVVSGNTCLTFKLGHFSIVVESTSPVLTPSPAPSPPIPGGKGKGKGKDHRVWIIVGCAVGGCGLLVVLIMWIRGYKRRKKMHKMERAADAGEALDMTSMGGMKAPAAMVTRTQPTLETEYAP